MISRSVVIASAMDHDTFNENHTLAEKQTLFAGFHMHIRMGS